MAGKVRFSVTTAGGNALEVESECQPLRDILSDLEEYGYSFGETLSKEGVEILGDYEPQDGDEIETHESAGGN